jgi:hypothetical protein
VGSTIATYTLLLLLRHCNSMCLKTNREVHRIAMLSSIKLTKQLRWRNNSSRSSSSSSSSRRQRYVGVFIGGGRGGGVLARARVSRGAVGVFITAKIYRRPIGRTPAPWPLPCLGPAENT